MKYVKAGSMDSPISFPIAVVVSRFNSEITQALEEGAIKQLQDRGFSTEDITVIEVPGAVEIPLITKQLAKVKQYDVIIALGAVIRGDTTHYDYVCQQVSDGCQRVAIDYDTPVIFGVLTTENEAQAWERLGGPHGHKGRDAVDSAIAMRAILKQL